MSKKLKCDNCKTDTKQELYDLCITNCHECDNWNLSEIQWLLALKMKENGFDWHNFADQIDILSKRGTAKDIFLGKVKAVDDSFMKLKIEPTDSD